MLERDEEVRTAQAGNNISRDQSFLQQIYDKPGGAYDSPEKIGRSQNSSRQETNSIKNKPEEAKKAGANAPASHLKRNAEMNDDSLTDRGVKGNDEQVARVGLLD